VSSTRATNRDEIILAHVKRHGLGLEIGPAHAPIAPKAAGFHVHVLDHASREQLIEKYREHGVDLTKIEPVDFIWDGRPFPELVGRTCTYDWIIASHVIEHSTDLVGFLNDCDALLKSDGVLSLAIPDMRWCFDHFRAPSSLGRVIDAAQTGRRAHSAGSAAEYFLDVVQKGGRLGWSKGETGEYALRHSVGEAKRAMTEKTAYLDIHEWCFTPTSFRLLVRDLLDLELIQLKELAFHPTSGHEFYVTLSRGGERPPQARLEMLQQIANELAERAQ